MKRSTISATVLALALCLVLPSLATAQDAGELLPVGSSYAWGGEDALVTVVEFGDYQCPFCARADTTMEEVLKAYDGKVRLVFKHNPLSFHKDAQQAAEAALAAGEQGRYLEMHRLLFKNPRSLGREQLEEYARGLGLDTQAFRESLDRHRFLPEIEADQKLAGKVGATGTPTFFVNGRRLAGAQSLELFKATVDEELAALEKAPDKRYAARVALNYEPPKERPARANEDTEVYKVSLGKAPVRGDARKALVTLVVFTDFQCPFCARASGTVAELMAKHPDVRLVLKHYPLPFHKDAELAAVAAMAAGEQGKFWEMHDLLFANNKALGRDDLVGYGDQLGLNMSKFKKALDHPEPYIKKIKADMAEGVKVGVRGTPHFFVNGVRLSGAQPLDRFEAAYQSALERAAALTKKGLKGDALYAGLMKGARDHVAPTPSATPDGAVLEAPVDFDLRGAPTRGGVKAPVTVVIISDFQCPFCARATGTVKQVAETYGDAVQLVFLHNPLPFHNDALPAAKASWAAQQQGKFWEMHDLLFENQRGLSEDELYGYGSRLGLDMQRFKEDMQSPAADKKIKADQGQAAGAGATGTPTFFINGHKLVGAQPFERFKEMIDAELAALGKGGKSGKKAKKIK